MPTDMEEMPLPVIYRPGSESHLLRKRWRIVTVVPLTNLGRNSITPEVFFDSTTSFYEQIVVHIAMFTLLWKL